MACKTCSINAVAVMRTDRNLNEISLFGVKDEAVEHCVSLCAVNNDTYNVMLYGLPVDADCSEVENR